MNVSKVSRKSAHTQSTLKVLGHADLIDKKREAKLYQKICRRSLELPSKWCPALVRAEHGKARSSRTGMPGEGGTHQRRGGCDLGLQAS
jgi:hypothetical protein